MYGNVQAIPIEWCTATDRTLPTPPSLWLKAEEDDLPPLYAVKSETGFHIVSGIQIWQAAQLAGRHQVDAIVINQHSDGPGRMELESDPITEARALAILKETHGLSDQELGNRIHWTRKKVADYRRLLRLAPEVQEMVAARRLGYAKAAELVSIPTHQQYRLADQALKLGWNLKDLRSMARKWKWTRKEQGGETPKATVATAPPATAEDPFTDYSEDPDIARLERELEDNVGCKVRLQQAEGVLLLKYGDLDVLEGITDRLMSNAGRAGDRY